MPKAHLTQTFVANAGCEVGKKKTDWYCTTVTGFVLECRCTGGTTYYLRYVDQAGGQKQYKIGGYQDVTFAAAKKKAQQLRSEVVMGGDPGAKKALARSVPLYGELAEKHLAFAKIHLKSYSDLEAAMRNHIVPRWGRTRLTDMTSQTVALWLSEKRSEGLAPASVERLRAILGRSFVLGASWDIPGTEKIPTRGLGKRINNARDRFLSAEEAARLREAVFKSQNPQLKHIVGLLLLTGARLRELLDAEWKNVDISRRSWLIPTSKTGRSRHVPLSTAAIEILEELPRFKQCPFLLPNPDTLRPYVSIKNGWRRAVREADLSGLRLHDLRHSAASFLVSANIDLYTIGKILGHANVASTARYSHLSNSTLLAAVEAGAAKQAAT